MKFLALLVILVVILFGSVESRFGVGSRTGFAGTERWGYVYKRRNELKKQNE